MPARLAGAARRRLAARAHPLDPAMSDCVFELDDVRFSYRDKAALDGVTVRIRRGQRVVLLGANGSGKSTLLRLLDALCFPSAGDLRAFDDRLTEEAFAD